MKCYKIFKFILILFVLETSLVLHAEITLEGLNGYAALERGDFQQAYNEFSQGYKNGDNFLCACGIGDLYHYGFILPQDDQLAFSYYMVAAQEGNPQAQYYVGIHYETGTGVEKNICIAQKWYRIASENQEYKDLFSFEIYGSANNLAYLIGTGACDGNSDLTSAIKYYRFAAEGGVPEAQYSIGMFYLEGIGEYPKDINEGIKWLRKSAEQGFAKAQIKLAQLGY